MSVRNTVVVLVLAYGLVGCGSSHRARIENQTTRTIYAGIMEQTPGRGARMLDNATIPPGEEAKLDASPKGEKGSACILLVGDSPSPRARARTSRLEKGNNKFTVMEPDSSKSAPIFLERQE